jgi:hypothetical protein
MDRIKEIRSLGVNVDIGNSLFTKIILWFNLEWECDVMREIKQDLEMKTFFDESETKGYIGLCLDLKK